MVKLYATAFSEHLLGKEKKTSWVNVQTLNEIIKKKIIKNMYLKWKRNLDTPTNHSWRYSPTNILVLIY